MFVTGIEPSKSLAPVARRLEARWAGDPRRLSDLLAAARAEESLAADWLCLRRVLANTGAVIVRDVPVDSDA